MQYVTALSKNWNWSKHMQKGGQKQKKRYCIVYEESENEKAKEAM